MDPTPTLTFNPNRYKSAGEVALFMDSLYRRGGYYLTDRHDNPYCQHCTEVVLTRHPLLALAGGGKVQHAPGFVKTPPDEEDDDEADGRAAPQ